MLSAIWSNLDQSKILSSGNELKTSWKIEKTVVTSIFSFPHNILYLMVGIFTVLKHSSFLFHKYKQFGPGLSLSLVMGQKNDILCFML